MNEPEHLLPSNGSRVDPFYVGDWCIQPALNRMTGEAGGVQIEPRIMHVLACLASRPGEVLSRATLLEVVWNRTIVNEEALTQAISQLRRVFGDDPKSPGYIQTIPKSGYRLIAPVSRDRRAAAPSAYEQAEARPKGTGRRLAWYAGTAGLLTLGAAVAVLLIGRSGTPPTFLPLDERPFTSDPGEEICPALSPDGTRVAYSWKREGTNQYDLYVRQQNSEAVLQLTDTPSDEYYAAWSPDGSRIAYAFDSEEGTAVYTIPSIGGSPRKAFEVAWQVGGIDWSPDGERLAYASRIGPGEPFRLYSYSFATREVTPHTSPRKGSRGDVRPAFSPDGRRIAFVRGDRTNLQDVFVISLEDGGLERMTHCQHQVSGLDWMPDGRSLIFSSGPTRAGDFRLWRLVLRDASLIWLPSRGHRPIRPSVSNQGARLVYEEQSVECNILRLRVRDSEDPDAPPLPLIASTLHDYGPQYSPGGSRISFISNRSGSPQIWVCDGEGQNARQITDFEGAYIENPCWSCDERRVAFSAAPGNYSAIYVVELATREVRCLSTSERHEKCIGWSRDGEWLYCKSERDDAWRVWKRRVDGDESVDIIERDIFRLAEAIDGEHLLYSRADTTGIWSAGLDGTGERCIVNEPGYVVPCGWREVERGIYFFSTDEGSMTLWLLDASTGRPAFVASSRRFFAINIDVSPDGGAVIYDKLGPFRSDLILAENFR